MALTMRQWRMAKEISQEAIAKQLGVHVNTYLNWEKAPEKISVAHAEKIAEILGVPIEDIEFKKA